MIWICKIRLILYVLLNIFFSNTILVITKILYTEFGIPSLTLTCFYCFTTSLGLVLCDKLHVFRSKDLPLQQIIPGAIIYSGYVASTYVSLKKNSVGTHLVVKAMSPILVVIIQTYFHRQEFNTNIKLSTIAGSCGILFSYIYDVQLDIIGFVFALAGCSLSSLYHIWVCDKYREFQASPLQILFHMIPISALMLLPIALFVEPIGQLSDMLDALPYTTYILVGAACFAIFFLNITTNAILAEISPLTYGMIGNIKLCILFLLGLILYLVNSQLLRDPQGMVAFADIFAVDVVGPNSVNVLGVMLALAGMHFRMSADSLENVMSKDWAEFKRVNDNGVMLYFNTRGHEKELSDLPELRSHETNRQTLAIFATVEESSIFL